MLSAICWFYVLDISMLYDGNLGEAVFSFAMTTCTLKEYKCITDVTMRSSERHV